MQGASPGPARQPLEGELSLVSHLGWALMAQMVSRELLSMIFSNCHWALGLQPLVSASSAVSPCLGHPCDFIDLISEA